jgi:hypothetical protein
MLGHPEGLNHLPEVRLQVQVITHLPEVQVLNVIYRVLGAGVGWGRRGRSYLRKLQRLSFLQGFPGDALSTG